MIPKDLYVQIIDTLPILCVDALILNDKGQYLLVKRSNEPLKDEWWTVGGRVQKGETGQQAIRRKVHDEVGLKIVSTEFYGVYEDFFDRNSFRQDTLYHTVSLVYVVTVEDFSSIKLDEQSVDWRFADAVPQRLLQKTIRQQSLMNRD